MSESTRERDCEICAHAAEKHDGMGDCTHPDARTGTGFCAAHEHYERQATR